MSLYHEAAQILTASTTEGGSLKSRVFGDKRLKSPPNQLYALVLETRKWSAVLKEVVERAELLQHERKVSDLLSRKSCPRPARLDMRWQGAGFRVGSTGS